MPDNQPAGPFAVYSAVLPDPLNSLSRCKLQLWNENQGLLTFYLQTKIQCSPLSHMQALSVRRLSERVMLNRCYRVFQKGLFYSADTIYSLIHLALCTRCSLEDIILSLFCHFLSSLSFYLSYLSVGSARRARSVYHWPTRTSCKCLLCHCLNSSTSSSNVRSPE